MREISPATGLPLFSENPPAFLTVSELNQIVKATLEKELDAFWVVGEISNFRVPPSGHLYFTLKDDRACLDAVIWRGGPSLPRGGVDTGRRPW